MKFKVFALVAVFIVATVAPANAGGRSFNRDSVRGSVSSARVAAVAADPALISTGTVFTLKASIPGLNGCC